MTSMISSSDLSHKIRKKALELTSKAKASHIGSIFSVADIISVLFSRVLHLKPENLSWSERDRFILSKGHSGLSVYVALAELRFFPEDLLNSYCQNGSILSGHVSHKNVPGVEFSTGSLGHGLSVSVGKAYALKQKKSNSRTFTVMSDGECDEGSVWEAVLFAAHHKLNNVIVVIDYNKIQSLDLVSKTLALEPFKDKWVSFGWDVSEVDGHNHDALYVALSQNRKESEKPFCIIAHTTKGKGVSFMENSVLWHYRTAQGEEFSRALQELEERKE